MACTVSPYCLATAANTPSAVQLSDIKFLITFPLKRGVRGCKERMILRLLLQVVCWVLLVCSTSSSLSTASPSTSSATASAAAGARKLYFGRTGNIHIDFDVSDRFNAAQSWPEAIRLVNK